MKKCNATMLDAELKAAGIPIHGCSGVGRIDFMDEATDEQRKLAAQVLESHDSEKCCSEQTRCDAINLAMQHHGNLTGLKSLREHAEECGVNKDYLAEIDKKVAEAEKARDDALSKCL